jgi:hypothetical protein
MLVGVRERHWTAWRIGPERRTARTGGRIPGWYGAWSAQRLRPRAICGGQLAGAKLCPGIRLLKFEKDSVTAIHRPPTALPQ